VDCGLSRVMISDWKRFEPEEGESRIEIDGASLRAADTAL